MVETLPRLWLARTVPYRPTPRSLHCFGTPCSALLVLLHHHEIHSARGARRPYSVGTRH
jgi:hypothetical protein